MKIIIPWGMWGGAVQPRAPYHPKVNYLPIEISGRFSFFIDIIDDNSHG